MLNRFDIQRQRTRMAASQVPQDSSLRRVLTGREPRTAPTRTPRETM